MFRTTWKAIAVAVYLQFIILGGLSVAVESQCHFKEHESSGNGSHEAPGLERSTQCIQRDDDNSGLVHGVCTRFLANRCHLYSNGTDLQFQVSQKINHTLNTVIIAVDTATRRHNNDEDDDDWDDDEVAVCRDIFLALVCNSLYPGCDPETGGPVGLCKETCLEYATRDTCSEFFVDTIGLLHEEKADSGYDMRLNCNSYFLAPNDTAFHTDTTTDCYKDLVGVRMRATTTAEEGNQTTRETDTTEGKVNFDMLVFAYIIPSVSVVLGSCTVLTVLLLSCCYITKLKKRSSRSVGVTRWSPDTEAFPHSTRTEEVYTNPYTFQLSIGGTSQPSSGEASQDQQPTTRPITSTTHSTTTGDTDVFQLNLADWKSVGDGILIPFEHISITGCLGEGAFGYVVKGLLKDIRANKQEYHIPIAMKTLKNCASYDEMRGLLLESSLMHSFSHAHILGLRGICLDPRSGSPYLVMSFMEHGDLRSFLRRRTELTESTASVTTYPEGLNHEVLARMCSDVAQGMEYLAEKRLVHRDLAARNCMVDRDLRVKVADFGLTREIYQQDYYRQSSHGQLPIKWMSPESLAYRLSNEKTDVWSFGVTCWEVFSLGKIPYPTIANCDLLDCLETGRRLTKPRLCSQHMYDVMQLCWKLEPNERPTFSEIASLLAYANKPHKQNYSSVSNGGEDENAADGNSKSEDNEYIEMMCLNDDDVGTDGSRGTERTTHGYLNLNFDSSGEDVETVRGAALAVVTQTDMYCSQDVFVITNSAATTQSRSPSRQKCGREEGGLLNAPAEKKPLAWNSNSAAQNSKEESEESGERDGLLDSIIQYFKEKPQSEEYHADIDGPLLALQMEDLESGDANSENVQGDIEPSSKVLIPPTENRIHSSERETPQQQAGSTIARVKTGPCETEEDDDVLHYHQASSYIYDECPTTPNVTIAFKTGEKVTPSETIFAFTPNTSRVTQAGTNRTCTGECSSNVFQKKRTAAAMCSNTTPSPSEGKRYSAVTMPTGGNHAHVQAGRQRFYSATSDYVRMHPAPPS